jgi:hypothetical protein
MEPPRTLKYHLTNMQELPGFSYIAALNSPKGKEWFGGRTPEILLVINDHGIAYHLQGHGLGFPAILGEDGLPLRDYARESFVDINDNAEIKARINQQVSRYMNGEYRALVHTSYERQFRSIAEGLGLKIENASRI